MSSNKRIKVLIESLFKEISVPQKVDITAQIKKLLAATENPEFQSKEELQNQLDDLLRFYKYSDDEFYTQENQAIYLELKNKLNNLQQAYQIP